MNAPLETALLGEGRAHRELKQLAVAWARANRLTLTGTEVRLPRSAYRADVAAATSRQLGPNAVTAVFECKASRARFPARRRGRGGDSGKELLALASRTGDAQPADWRAPSRPEAGRGIVSGV